MDVSNLPDWFHFYRNLSELPESNNASDNMNLQSEKNALIFSWKDTFHSSIELLIINQIKRSFLNDKTRDFSFIVGEIVKNSTTLRPLLTIMKSNNISDSSSIRRVSANFDEWLVRHEQPEECDDCRSEVEKIISVLIILVCSCLFVTLIMGVVALARNQLMKKRVSKGPYKVLLTATDFVFPQIADSRRVSIRVGIISEI